jgi:dihydrolipoamide dehydrogenase
MGVSVSAPKLDLPAMMNFKQQGIDGNVKGVEFLMKKNKVEMIAGYGQLAGPGRVTVSTPQGETKTLETRAVILATGSVARMIPGLEADPQFILTNIEILDLTAVPKSLGIIGAGAVGVEFASIFRRFGTQVTILEMLPRLVPVEDEDVSKELERHFKKIGIRVECGAKAENITRTGSSVKLDATLASGAKETMEFEKLLVAVGRKPNTANLGLEGTPIELDRGFIKVDPHQQTALPGVYAIGDIVAGTPQLAHVASAEAMVAVAHIAGKPAQPINRLRIPGATYTAPGIGSVGMTEAQARAAGHDIKVGKFPFAANSKASIVGHHEGFVKVVADAKFGEILGVHIIGHHGYELIAEAVAAMEAEATVDTLISTIHAHPTQYEALGEAFNAVYGMAINA